MSRVICEDGATRHDTPFDDREDAARFAEWGHICLANHAIEPIDTVDPRFMVFVDTPSKGRVFASPDREFEFKLLVLTVFEFMASAMPEFRLVA